MKFRWPRFTSGADFSEVLESLRPCNVKSFERWDAGDAPQEVKDHYDKAVDQFIAMHTEQDLARVEIWMGRVPGNEVMKRRLEKALEAFERIKHTLMTMEPHQNPPEWTRCPTCNCENVSLGMKEWLNCEWCDEIYDSKGAPVLKTPEHESPSKGSKAIAAEEVMTSEVQGRTTGAPRIDPTWPNAYGYLNDPRNQRDFDTEARPDTRSAEQGKSGQHEPVPRQEPGSLPEPAPLDDK